VLSNDLGRSFCDECKVFEQPHSHRAPARSATTADYLQEMDDWTFGRIDAVAGPNDEISIVFYSGDQNATSICWSRLIL
jgi:hypothetical protein